ncbi:hypothetical protein OpiT1DRAFT_00423 [Opitutaceae bacterium TAV1]|nr:hypothetical protein OpiT1DRAFT_00423 [Opitutaceae bacterium TAV1]
MKTSIRTSFHALAAAGVLAFAAGCHRHDDHAGHNHAAESGGHHHEHKPPHGGTPVVLGDEAFHLELVRDAEAGRLQLYVMDGELENFIRIPAASINLTATVNGEPQTLVLRPVANEATGETVGDTSLFEAEADWIKTTADFDATLETITVKGAAFNDVKFNFPKGNDHDEDGDHDHKH